MTLQNVSNPLGDRFHLVDLNSDRTLAYWLGVMSNRETCQARLALAVQRIYEILWDRTLGLELIHATGSITTPMAEFVGDRKATFTAPAVPSETRPLIVGLLTAAEIPYHVFRMRALELFDHVTTDPLMAERQTDSEGRVTHTRVLFDKAAFHLDPGVVNGATLLIPDIMGATGSSDVTVVEEYRRRGDFRVCYLVHAIVVPEYFKAIAKLGDPRVHVVAGRLDKELTDKGYIVPGAGDMGKRLRGLS